ncbi:hypothetical protein QUV83_05220 [Cellulomonas cellasea]|uniref:hypothetical protein n=1 Tax=Cellulomonas cellasea TaxID=43670 RepID=UPI0025A4886D|nr:hypothetical protein [Cellulomonas cellasea]MDM8084162.1 hypothetical protein [Cellulomonas cellasea]
MPLFSRRPSLPDPVRGRLALPPRDRVLAVVELADGRWAVATRLALCLADTGAEAGAVRRRPWIDVDRAQLTVETSTITVHWVDGTTEDLPLTERGAPAFAQTLRERVQSSVVHSETVVLPGGSTVRVALRRDEQGDLVSQVIGDGSVDLSQPRVGALVDAAELRVRRAAGLPD